MTADNAGRQGESPPGRPWHNDLWREIAMPEQHSSRPVRGVGYYRKSNEDDGESVEQQQAWARAAAPEEGIALVREFVDQAKAGHETASRADFAAMLDFCRKEARRGEPVEVIVCWNANRFSRSDSHETSWFLWEFRQAGVSRMFTANRGWIDFERMEDRVIQNIEQDVSNNKYVLDLAQDSTRGRLKGAGQGQWMGGPVPFAYRADVEKVTVKGRTKYRTARLILGPDGEVETVRRVFREYAGTGVGLLGLARRLTEEGVPSPKGGKWTTNTLKYVIKNPVYLGRLVWARRTEGKFFGVVGAKLVKKAGQRRRAANPPEAWVQAPRQTHEPLVDVPTWDRCQEKLARRKKDRQPRLGCYALSGLVRCGHCAATMIARVNVAPVGGRRGGRRRAYRVVYCGTYNRTSGCFYNSIAADPLVKAVVAKLRQGLYNPGTLQALREEIRRQDREEAAGAPLTALEARLAAAERGVARAARRVVDEEQDALVPALRQALAEVTAERDRLAKEVEAAKRKGRPADDLEAGVEEALAIMGRLEDAVKAEDSDLLRAVLGEAVSYVELFFTHAPTASGKRTRSTFARGLIYLRPQRLAQYIPVNGTS
jgi:site-specific DNA recombinase